MIKAKLSNNTLMNLQKLKEGRPIVFDGTLMGYAGDICICYGETENDILRDLAALGQGLQ